MSGPHIDPAAVSARLATVRDRVRSAGVDPDAVTICAVTKGFGAGAVRAALEAGLVDVGENYAQELVAKADQLEPGFQPRWHMIGTVQRNKVRRLAPHVALWQTVDRAELGSEIAQRAPGAQVLVQVNATGEPAKAGCSPDAVAPLVDALTALDLEVRGVMTVGPTDPTVDPRPAFTTAATLADQLGLPVRSMGMSGDLETAVACGATMVRVGTALFGARPRGVTADPRADV